MCNFVFVSAGQRQRMGTMNFTPTPNHIVPSEIGESANQKHRESARVRLHCTKA